MDKNIIKKGKEVLSQMLQLPQPVIQNLMEQYQLIEQRKTDFFWIGFLYSCITCVFHGHTRHKDHVACYNREFGRGLTESISSDRLAAIPPSFFLSLLTLIQQNRDQSNKKKRKKTQNQITKLIT